MSRSSLACLRIVLQAALTIILIIDFCLTFLGILAVGIYVVSVDRKQVVDNKNILIAVTAVLTVSVLLSTKV